MLRASAVGDATCARSRRRLATRATTMAVSQAHVHEILEAREDLRDAGANPLLPAGDGLVDGHGTLQESALSVLQVLALEFPDAIAPHFGPGKAAHGGHLHAD